LSEQGGSVLGSGRSVVFAKKVVEHYCQAAAQKQNIWIQIGQGHRDQVECLLKKYLPDQAQVHASSAEDLKKKYDLWKTEAKPMLDELRDMVAKKSPGVNLSIKTETDPNPKSLTIVSSDEIVVSVLNAKNVRFDDFKTIIEKRGYIARKSLDIPGEIVSLTITFDITKLDL